MSDPILFWAAALVAAFFVGASKGGLPAVALLSVPLLSLTMSPLQGAALLLPVYIISDIYGLWIYRRSFSARNLAILIPAGLLGILLGWLLAERTNDDAVRIAIGMVGLGFIGLRVWSRFQGARQAAGATVPKGVFWGGVSGFTSFVAHAGGPAFQIYVLPQQLPKLTFAGTSTILFAILNLSKVPPYMALGLFHPGEMRIAAVLAPLALVGVWVGYRLTRILPERIFFVLVEITLFIISVLLIREGLRG
ncbi:TSUP family transporter [Alphaproteobacteria bacterium GH1-50]|uniref:Probable membrane transporter protein n=1 Tax=Kangsaoukella pontilimi TaxID=2691042 RepID=A0A7C9MC90_9RHOB|nr:sulfite exporter TauE/SafE family protein [Kangsaoukella pontilimi]MXQ09253.1 TSUP family transporter [Kangsaoukella pontilimi]